MKAIGAAIWLVAVAAVAVCPAATIEDEGVVSAVTVYRGQALVTRNVHVPGPAGLHEVVVTGLPARVVAGSVYAESADGVMVRSVRYRVRPVAEDVREEVKQLDARIRAAEDDLRRNQRFQELANDYREYLGRLEDFTAPTANVELTQGVLNADTLKALTLFLAGERRSLAQEDLKLASEQREINEQIDLLHRQRDELTGGSARTLREAVVFVDLRRDAGADLRVRYLVDGASWSPSYNVRTNTARDGVEVEYNASVQQMSGENWNNVAMTLSTATPTLAATSPVLTPLRVALGAAQQQAGKGDYAESRSQLDQRIRQLEQVRNSYFAESGDAQRQVQEMIRQQSETQYGKSSKVVDRELNDLAANIQVLDLSYHGKIPGGGERETTDESVSVTYVLPGKTTLPSRSDRQLVTIAASPMPAEFYRVATPVLTQYVYEEASVANDADMVLLAGPASAYINGEFVGNGEIPTVASGETFTVGFGVDSSLRATRELLKRHETVQGGNRIVTFSYRLAIENFGAEPTAIRLMDRLPQATERDIKVTLDPDTPELCRDRDYVERDKKHGLLRWDVEVPGRARGTQALNLDYVFRLEYDKESVITGLAMAL